MLTSGDVEIEPATPKIYPLTTSSVVMIAGDASLQYEILLELGAFVADWLKKSPKVWIPIGGLAIEYNSVYQAIKSRRAESRVLRPLGLTLDTFIKRQKEMADSVVEKLTGELVNFDMPGIEAIVAGIDTTGAHIYVCNNTEVSCRDAIGFAAIGAGYWHANSQFMFAKHNRTRPLAETLLLTYAAKRRAEVAPGVGEGTDMFSLGPNLGTYGPILKSIMEDVDQIYRDTRLRAEQSVKKANEEITKYVEQLGKAAAQQQESVAPATGHEKTDGAGDGREEAPAATKPN